MGHDFAYPPVDFETHPDRYKHWKLSVDGPVATLVMAVAEDGGMWPGRYELKLNSYDLGVDIELADAVQRLRFEHPEVRVVQITGGLDAKIFCAGANIRMLSMAPHAFKVNFCKFTNETRTSIEDATDHSGQHYVAALNGTASGGGYELALACEKIWLIDDGNAAVSLPEVPLLGVLPGTGGLTRITDKRRIRRDMADVFCTKAEGFRARDALKHDFIDAAWPRSQWEEGTARAAVDLAAEITDTLPLKKDGPGVALPALERDDTDDGWSYRFVDVVLDHDNGDRVATVTIKGPPSDGADADPVRGADTWCLRAFRELDDALLRLRVNHLGVGLILLRAEGDRDAILAHEAAMLRGADDDWFWREVQLFVARTLRRVDNTSKTFFAIIDEGSAFVGTLLELALAADRQYMFLDDDGENSVLLSEANEGVFPMASGISRLEARFPGDRDAIEAVVEVEGEIDAETCEELGLVTLSLDDIDWEDEVRIAIEERVSLSPDALTGMEQNLRFGGGETCETKIYGRLSAWQNWIFQRPNAVGDRGALSMFGHPERPIFDFNRT
ncbi:MAG: benzoyl-CoA-dihydrodiol lyase [Alphaproteobacteria bacterium]|nr:benzoyl-CoA-dihydrodiol lyase [Alphaproteobacteria bacterium]